MLSLKNIQVYYRRKLKYFLIIIEMFMLKSFIDILFE